ncbi:predicted protein [Arabidopsis lyrata subsp. lyrata]|uniref:Predicted protein n=1 Tax=Arabidopsis lyrata subsp. lyrata TaxID=81972 RepID=D7L728_ARALL|nr:predicted protein [Arabidopsis lyrata subsp. lyrata]
MVFTVALAAFKVFNLEVFACTMDWFCLSQQGQATTPTCSLTGLTDSNQIFWKTSLLYFQLHPIYYRLQRADLNPPQPAFFFLIH